MSQKAVCTDRLAFSTLDESSEPFGPPSDDHDSIYEASGKFARSLAFARKKRQETQSGTSSEAIFLDQFTRMIERDEASSTKTGSSPTRAPPSPRSSDTSSEQRLQQNERLSWADLTGEEQEASDTTSTADEHSQEGAVWDPLGMMQPEEAAKSKSQSSSWSTVASERDFETKDTRSFSWSKVWHKINPAGKAFGNQATERARVSEALIKHLKLSSQVSAPVCKGPADRDCLPTATCVQVTQNIGEDAWQLTKTESMRQVQQVPMAMTIPTVVFTPTIAVGVLPMNQMMPAISSMPNMHGSMQQTFWPCFEEAADEVNARKTARSSREPLHGYRCRSSPSPLPPLGSVHQFHPKCASTGYLSDDLRTFTKRTSAGRLSIISESEVHYSGVLRYAVQFAAGELSNADGVGFIFSTNLPCTKNIQKIVSIFVNRTGRICLRAHSDVERCDISIKPLELGDWLEVVCNLENRTMTFTVWPSEGGRTSTATVNFGRTIDSIRTQSPNMTKANCGYFAAVVKHVGVSLRLAS